MTALFSEWTWSVKRRDVREQDVENALAHHFCERVTRKNVECRIGECALALWSTAATRTGFTRGFDLL